MLRLFHSSACVLIQETNDQKMGFKVVTLTAVSSPSFLVLLITLGANEAVFNVSKRRHIYMVFRKEG